MSKVEGEGRLPGKGCCRWQMMSDDDDGRRKNF
jgi:hypothetical protein